MCGEEKIKALVELGKKQEQREPQDAARCYLEAADLLLAEAQENPVKHDEFFAVAQKLFYRGKQLKEAKPVLLAPLKKKTGTTFADIGGLEELKEDIRFKIIEPFKHPDLFTYYGKKAGGGILMYGPPGCGKTLIAKATATEADAQFIHVKGSTLKSKFVGETEKNIDELFTQARERPTIIFFDEFEAVGGDRTDAQPHERNFVAQLLTEMDGMESKDQQILLLAATNEPWAIDPALRREGRFGTTLFIPPPDMESRKSIIEIQMRKRPTEDLDYEKLARMTHNFSGADLKSLCETATEVVLKESLMTGKRRAITMADMERAVGKTHSVLGQWFTKARDQVRRRRLEGSFPELFNTGNTDTLTLSS